MRQLNAVGRRKLRITGTLVAVVALPGGASLPIPVAVNAISCASEVSDLASDNHDHVLARRLRSQVHASARLQPVLIDLQRSSSSHSARSSPVAADKAGR